MIIIRHSGGAEVAMAFIIGFLFFARCERNSRYTAGLLLPETSFRVWHDRTSLNERFICLRQGTYCMAQKADVFVPWDRGAIHCTLAQSVATGYAPCAPEKAGIYSVDFYVGYRLALVLG